MGTAADALNQARSQLGVEETGGPSGHDGNVVEYWTDIHHGEEEGQPWCAAFVEAVLEATGTTPVVDSQYCPTILDAYQKAGRAYPVGQAQPGDQVLYNFGEPNPPNHTGLLESIDPAAQSVTCIEGNTEPASGGDQADGGGVYRRTRPWSCVMAVGRPLYAAVSSASTTPGEAMGKFDLVAIDLVPGAAGDYAGRMPFYGTNRAGAVFAFNGATPVKGLNARTDLGPARTDVVGIRCIRNGLVVLFCDDGHPDAKDSDAWAASTYELGQ